MVPDTAFICLRRSRSWTVLTMQRLESTYGMKHPGSLLF